MLHSVWGHLNQELCSNDVTLTPNNSVFSLCVGETKNECAVRKICCGLDSHAAIRLLYDQAMLRCRSPFGQNLPLCAEWGGAGFGDDRRQAEPPCKFDQAGACDFI